MFTFPEGKKLCEVGEEFLENGIILTYPQIQRLPPPPDQRHDVPADPAAGWVLRPADPLDREQRAEDGRAGQHPEQRHQVPPALDRERLPAYRPAASE